MTSCSNTSSAGTSSASTSSNSLTVVTTDLEPVASHDQRLCKTAIATLGSLTKFSGNKIESDDTALNQAFQAIIPHIFFKQTALSDNEIMVILKYCVSLRKLNLSGCHQLTAAALPPIADLQKLTKLNLCGTQVNNLDPLIKSPLPKLRIVNFYQTEISSESLFAFLRSHKIRHLTPPRNPATKFFKKFPSKHLRVVILHIDECDDEHTMRFDEITRFCKNAPKLRKLWVWINGNTNFNSQDMSEPPTTREFIIESNTMAATIKLLGKKEKFQCRIQST